MKEYAKMLGFWLLAEVLTLFIDLTLSFSGNVFVRIVCAVCTLGIFLGLMIQGGYSAAKSDKKLHRAESSLRPWLLGLAGAAVPLCLTAVLVLSKLGAAADGFYRVYKLLCAPFLSVCNLLCADVVASAVPVGEIVLLLVLSLLPIPAAGIAYRMTASGKTPEDAMYRR